MLDCNTTEGKKFIKKENETRNILQNFYKDKFPKFANFKEITIFYTEKLVFKVIL